MEQNKRIQGGIIRIDSKCFPIYMGVNTVGRSKTAVVNIKHLNVSQNQALIVLVDARQHYLADMNSSNGTYLGTTKLIPFKLYELINEAEVKFGDVAATYLKVSSANSNVSLENQTLEMTQNMTQNFYAANTQIMESDESVINHSNNSDNSTGSQSYLFDDIHEMATQEPKFNRFINKMQSTEVTNSKKEQGIQGMSKNATIDIHDAPTQVVHFDNISNTENIHDAPTQVVHFDNISNTDNIHDAPTQVVHFDNISNTDNIDDAATQVVHFDTISNTENIHDAVTQVVHYDNVSNNAEINIHEAPTQVVQYPENKSVSPKQSNKIQKLRSNSSKSGSQESSDTIIVDLPGSSKLETKVTEESSLIPSPGPGPSVCPKQSNKIQHLHTNSSKSGSQGSSDTIIVNLSDSSKLETKVTEASSMISSPGPSVSQLNVTCDDSFLNNSKNVSGIERSEIEETLIDGNSNDSIDFLTMQVPPGFDETDNKENVENFNNENSQPESVRPKNGSLAVDSDLDPNKRLSQDSTQSSIIGPMRKTRKISSSTELEDSDNESTLGGVKKSEYNQTKNKSEDCESDQESNKRSSQNSTQSNKIGFVHKLRKLPSSTESSDEETTQDIIVKKPLKKLPSDSESENDSLHKVESLKKIKGLKVVFRTEDQLHEVPETDGAKKSNQDKNNESLDVIQSSDSDTDCEEHLDKFGMTSIGKSDNNLNENLRKASQEDLILNNKKNSQSNCKNDTEDKSKPSSSKMNSLDTSVEKNKEDKFNDSDYIPATQDAFADAFSYRSEAGKSSSTEDFRLGLTQLMEDSMNDGSLKTLEQMDHINNENNSGITISQQVKKVADVDISTEPINSVNLPHVAVEEDVYVMPTQQMEENINVHSKATSPDRDIYDIATQRLPENTNDKETENEDIYLLATQPINTDSQFKVPKSFTFKKKQTTILEKSLNTLLGDNDKDDDIFYAATQKMPEPVDVHEPSDGIKETDDVYCAPTQKMTETCEVQKPQSDIIEETEDLYDVPTQAIVVTSDDVYLQPTQFIEPSTKDVDLPSKSMQAASKQDVVNPLRPQNSANTDALFDEPTQPIEPDVQDVVNTREESSSTKPDEISKVVFEVPALRRSRRKSSSPLPELPERKNLKEITKHSTGGRFSPIVENADEDKDTVETLSQIERFVKQPFVKTYEKTRTRGKSINVRPETPEPEPTTSTKKRHHTSDLKQSELVKDVKETSMKKSKTVLSDSYNLESTSETGDEGEENNGKGQSVVKTSADLSLALLESKNTKSRKKITDPVLQDLKVVATSHRRSMGIAETSVVSSSKARRTTIATTSTRSKRNVEEVSKKNIDSETSDVDVPSKKSSRIRSKAASDNKTEEVPDSRRPGRNSRKPKTDESSSTSKSLTIKSSEENETATSDDNFEVARDSKKGSKGTSSKTSRSEESSVSAQSSEEKIEEPPPKKEKRTKRQIADVDNDVSVTKTPSKRGRVALKTDDDESLDRASSSGSSISTDLVSTPKKQKKPPVEGLLSSAERAKRKLKPKVVFTMLDNPQLESLIRQLGGSIVDTVNACTVLVTEHVKRSQKLLSAVGQGKPICSPQWIKDSKKSGEFLDPWDFILVDKEAEKKWSFSLKDSINRATNIKLLSDYTFHIMVANGADVLKGAIEACGGKCVSKVTGRNPDGTFVVIASPEQKSKYARLIKQNPSIKVVEPEAIFDGVLRQELRLSNHLLQ